MEYVHYVVPSSHSDGLLKKAHEIYGDEKIFPYAGGFFVATSESTMDVSTNLGIRDGAVGSGVVLRVTTYNGRAPADLWEWLGRELA